jgi:murein L,D-transpeptidase YcbB/YkuD
MSLAESGQAKRHPRSGGKRVFWKRICCVILLGMTTVRAQDCVDGLCELLASHRLPELRWPDFTEYAEPIERFYRSGGYRLKWFADGRAAPQALSLIAILKDSETKGLDAEDYDASRWPARLKEVANGTTSEKLEIADLALTVCVMRYVSDLHFGRLKPGIFNSRSGTAEEPFDLSEQLRQLANGIDPQRFLTELEPPFPGYQRARRALAIYLDLRKSIGKSDHQPISAPKLPIEPNSSFPDAARLAALLYRLGDLPDTAQQPADRYEGSLVEAVRRFQERHGLDMDGRIGRETLVELNTPIEQRIKQLELALERWRWAPHNFSRPPIVVNIPEFRLRAFDATYNAELEMNIVAGRAVRNQTPVFAASLSYLTFRPYWHVPISIVRKELLPAIARDASWLSKHRYEVVNLKGEVVTTSSPDQATLAGLHSGKFRLRQLPGERNSLGLIAFMFPNEHSVYMHATPATMFFDRSRRDFSHGCIRLEHPVELAEWVLKDEPAWTRQRIVDAMQGSRTLRLDLKRPVPVLIVYATAVALSNGKVHFFRDIYGDDAALESQLAKRYRRSAAPVPVRPNSASGQRYFSN